MKRFLLSLVAIMLTSLSFAQVSNNKKDVTTKETATQYSNDKELLDIYNQLKDKNRKKKTNIKVAETKQKDEKKEKTQKVAATKETIKKIVTPEMLYKRGKRMKVAGYIVGSTLFAYGIASVIAGATQNGYDEYIYAFDNSINHHKYWYEDGNPHLYAGYSAMAAGLIVGTPLIIKGYSLQQKNRDLVHSVSVINHDIKLNNGGSLNLGFDVLSNSLSYLKTPGIGIRYNF